MKEPRLPPMTLWGLRSGGFLKEPVYWWRKECMLWEVGGLPFFTIGSLSLLLLSSTVICSASSDRDSSIVWLPLSVRDSLLLNFFILSAGCSVKSSASARGHGLLRAGERMQVRWWRWPRRGASASGLPPPTSRLPLREGRRPPHACPSPPLNMAPGPWSRTDGPVVPGRGARSGTGRRGVQGRAQPPLSFVCVRVAFSRSAAAAA